MIPLLGVPILETEFPAYVSGFLSRVIGGSTTVFTPDSTTSTTGGTPSKIPYLVVGAIPAVLLLAGLIEHKKNKRNKHE